MERLWRPWRMAYVRTTGEVRDDCFLCVRGDELEIGRTELAFVILNRYPYNGGHLLVAPGRHVADPADLDEAETVEVWSLVNACIEAHRRTTRPDGFNVGLNLGRAAGAGVPGHLHVHVVPRWDGDVNFMPVVAGTKVLPEMLEDTKATLAPVLRDVIRTKRA